jgi:hypothetical protein
LTIVVAADAPDYRLIVRTILATVSDMMTIVGEAEDGAEALAVVLRELNRAGEAHQGRTAAEKDHPHEFLHRRCLPAHGL